MQSPETTEKNVTTAEENPDLRTLWRASLTPWWKATLAALPTFLVTRFLFLVLTYFGAILFNTQNSSSFVFTSQTILYNWYRWDVPRVLTIANQGYLDPSSTAHFPLYPTLVHLISAPLHLDILLTGMLITNFAFLGVLIVLYRLIEGEYDASTAKRSLLYLALFPTALFFFAAYSTALLLFCTLLCIYLLRQGRWWLAGCFGALAALTDIAGSFLFIIFLCEFFRQQGPHLHQLWSQKMRKASIIQLLPLLGAFLIPAALALYAYALKKPFHDPLIFLHAQGNTPTIGFGGLSTMMHLLNSGSLYSLAGAHALFELSLLLGMIALLVVSFTGRERLATGQWPLIVFGAMILLYALLVPNQPGLPPNPYDPMPALQSAALLFIPGFVVLARLGRYPWVHQTYVLVSTPLLALLIFQMFKMLWAL